MSGCTANHFSQIVSGYHSIGVGSANPERIFISNPAGTHVTDTTTNTGATEFTLFSLTIHAGKTGIYAVGPGFGENLD